MILIFLCSFVTIFNKNVFLSTALDSPVILDGQFSSILQSFITYFLHFLVLMTPFIIDLILGPNINDEPGKMILKVAKGRMDNPK
jgi:hypothetical protein